MAAKRIVVLVLASNTLAQMSSMENMSSSSSLMRGDTSISHSMDSPADLSGSYTTARDPSSVDSATSSVVVTTETKTMASMSTGTGEVMPNATSTGPVPVQATGAALSASIGLAVITVTLAALIQL